MGKFDKNKNDEVSRNMKIFKRKNNKAKLELMKSHIKCQAFDELHIEINPERVQKQVR